MTDRVREVETGNWSSSTEPPNPHCSKGELTMTRAVQRQTTLHSLVGLSIAVVAAAVTLASGHAAAADSTPVGSLPPGPVSTTHTTLNQLVAVALPHASKASGLTWRLARGYDPTVVREISEADVDASVVIVYKVIGRGDTALVFALTRGDTSSKAVKSATHKIEAR
jgi:hypothetical protein